jgi:small subunit ribosomal protein S8
MIARIKNAAMRKRSKVSTPASLMRGRVLEVLQTEGYIRGYALVEEPGKHPEYEIELKYFDGEPVIAEISRVSKPGRRVYSSIRDLKPVRNGLGISILSTPKGVMSDAAARDQNVGGEVLCRVY